MTYVSKLQEKNHNKIELIEQMLELQAPTEHQHNYSLEKLLGKGSFGKVWKATDKTTKMLPSNRYVSAHI